MNCTRRIDTDIIKAPHLIKLTVLAFDKAKKIPVFLPTILTLIFSDYPQILLPFFRQALLSQIFVLYNLGNHFKQKNKFCQPNIPYFNQECKWKHMYFFLALVEVKL
jgi:hypothetical protein